MPLGIYITPVSVYQSYLPLPICITSLSTSGLLTGLSMSGLSTGLLTSCLLMVFG